jgi:pentatricopeptide repeat protein
MITVNVMAALLRSTSVKPMITHTPVPSLLSLVLCILQGGEWSLAIELLHEMEAQGIQVLIAQRISTVSVTLMMI